MKKNARKWAVLLILTLIFSFEGMAVFAENEEQGADVVSDTDLEFVQDEAKAAEAGDAEAAMYTVTWKNYDGTVLDTTQVAEGETPSYSGTPTRDADDTYTYTFSGWLPTPAPATKDTVYTAQYSSVKTPPAKPVLKVYAGQNSLTAYWDADPKADHYIVWLRTGNGAWRVLSSNVKNTNLRWMPYSEGNKWQQKVSYTATGLDEYTGYTFSVEAVSGDGIKSESKWVTRMPIRPINYVLTMKKKVSLSSHGGPARTITLQKGEVVKAYGFHSGKYVFKRNGSIFYVAKSRGKKIYANYASSWNYSRQDAENYVNTANIGSSSKSTLIWVSTYCQHVYYFSGYKGNWRCIKDWECSTGKAQSPSPTGMYGNKEIGKKIKKRHGIQWWSTYSSMNAFHGKLRSWKLGAPRSGGCIRNEVANALYIYNNAPKYTKVLIN